MSLLKKKMKKAGKGTDKPESFRKEFDVLNYTPADYQYTERYVRFVNQAESMFGRVINRVSVDELCSDMFDPYIDSVMEQMKGFAKEQYTNHIHLINHHKGILEGELALACGHMEDLKKDLEELNQEISTYKQLKNDKHIL